MAIKVSRNFRFSDIKLTPGRAAMEDAGDFLVKRIVRRTQSGRDEDNRKFAGYPGRPHTTVDLTDTGQMLEQDLQPVVVTETRVGIGFTTYRSANIADHHLEGHGRLPVRRFLGIPSSWVREVTTMIARALKL